MEWSACSCGETLGQVGKRHDHGQPRDLTYEWVLAASHDRPYDVDRTQVTICHGCGRLWIAWSDRKEVSEYLPVSRTH